jgi:hypothetical protein
MDQKKVFEQVIEFQKGVFDNSFNALEKLQEQGETMVKTFLSQASWLPEENRNAVADWLKACKKAQTEYKITVDANFDKVKKLFESPKPDKLGDES